MNYFFHKLHLQDKRNSGFLLKQATTFFCMLTCKGLYFCMSWTHIKDLSAPVFMLSQYFEVFLGLTFCPFWICLPFVIAPFIPFWICLYFCCTLNLGLHNKFEQKPIAFFKIQLHIVQTQRFAFHAVVTPYLTMQTLGSNVVLECIVIYSSC